MKRILKCECGAVFDDTDENALIAAARRHGLETHRVSFSTEQLLALSRPAVPATGENGSTQRT